MAGSSIPRKAFSLKSKARPIVFRVSRADWKRKSRARAIIQSWSRPTSTPLGYEDFEIRESTDHGGKSALILPDIATCADCLREIFDPDDRRFRYPFTNCTNCGPRFSIIEALPYDRANTSMKKFAMCADCAREYHDPARPPFPRATKRLPALRSAARSFGTRRRKHRPGRRALLRRPRQ